MSKILSTLTNYIDYMKTMSRFKRDLKENEIKGTQCYDCKYCKLYAGTSFRCKVTKEFLTKGIDRYWCEYYKKEV